MKTLPTIGEEYEYLNSPVKVLRIVPCEGFPDDEAQVEFETRFSERGTCTVADLTARRGLLPPPAPPKPTRRMMG